MRADDIASIVNHARGEWPNEACGILMENPAGVRMLYPAPNLIGLLHHAEPIAWRPPTEGYVMDPKSLKAALSWRTQGFELTVLYHSHTNGAPSLSAEDIRVALKPDGTPYFPKVVYLVVGVARAGSVPTLTAWSWTGKRFGERKVVAA
jgi:proteasome lid subunit RPN8/RPN11